MSFDTDAVIVGAGCVGLACGFALAKQGLSVIVLEKEHHIGEGVSSRNSEVVHGGLYYPTGSLKARFCVEGRRKLYAFLEQHHVAYDKCGKLVVAAEADDIAKLDAIYQQALANDVEGMSHLTAAQAHALEPEVRAAAALLSAESGIMDSHGYMLALQGEIEDHGGAVVLSTPFEAAEPLPEGGFQIRAGGAEPTVMTTRLLVIAASLGAQACAHNIEAYPRDLIPALHFGKGNYFSYHGKAPFQRLVYPTPIPGALGTHYRRDLGGQARFGPDLEWTDVEDYSVDPARADEFYHYVRKFWPGLPDGALTPDYAGIRPKIHGRGEKQPDFRLDGVETHGLPGLMALFGIESPGLTSSLAIGDEVARRLKAAG
jgi:L-2-hydroxyglutarate oxidase LhgO